MMKKMLSVLCAAVLGVLLITGCSQNQNQDLQNQTTGAPSQEEPQTQAPKPAGTKEELTSVLKDGKVVVSIGMTKDEVEQALGKPDLNVSNMSTYAGLDEYYKDGAAYKITISTEDYALSNKLAAGKKIKDAQNTYGDVLERSQDMVEGAEWMGTVTYDEAFAPVTTGNGSNAAYVVSLVCNDMKTEVIDNITIEKVK